MTRGIHTADLHHRLGFKLVMTVGVTLLVSMSAWAYFDIRHQKEKAIQRVVATANMLTETIRLGAHYAMKLNSRQDINEIVSDICRQEAIENIRIYNKKGQIRFSSLPAEVDTTTNIKAEACYICHRNDPPLSSLRLEERTRILRSEKGHRLLGVISPIYNERGCSTETCHVHPPDKTVLGALDVVVSLEETDAEVVFAQKEVITLAVIVFLVTTTIIFAFFLLFVTTPISRLIEGTRAIARGEYDAGVDLVQNDELGELGAAINDMRRQIEEKEITLNRKRDEYQNLFELVPCLITVQDRNYVLLSYNQEFAEKFAPTPGDYCYHAYKGRDRKCPHCPVERTFEDGNAHYGEEVGVNKDGTPTHWIFKTSPIRDESGGIVAAMEMSVDITQTKQLEEKLEVSEKKYQAIFNNIPNPVFVLDADSLEILDCNDSVGAVYGYARGQITGGSFLEFFLETEREHYAHRIKESSTANQVRHRDCSGKTLYVNIRIASYDYAGRKVLLVTTADITKRLEAEQQLIQASKMATLGEMASGIAHELNQPLSVIKTATSFLAGKVRRKEAVEEAVLSTLLCKADSNVDRATKIINHMRQFARKSEVELVKVQVNKVLESAFEIFSQQLKVRGIQVRWETEKHLPLVKADPGRLEQVFINILLNARDAIEEKTVLPGYPGGEETITIRTAREGGEVMVAICDTGKGIPKAIADRIFEPFFTTKEHGKGTGLGLSISYSIIQECGASIRAFSEEGKETCFVVRFPVKDEGR